MLLALLPGLILKTLQETKSLNQVRSPSYFRIFFATLPINLKQLLYSGT